MQPPTYMYMCELHAKRTWVPSMGLSRGPGVRTSRRRWHSHQTKTTIKSTKAFTQIEYRIFAVDAT